METILDTYAFITKLKEAGMPEPQAVVMSDIIKQVEQSTSDTIKQVKQSTFDTIKQSEQSRSDVLATKVDVQAVKADIQAVKAEILQVKTELSGQIMLLRWMLGFILALNVSIAFKIFFIH
jgi:polyhydroxyalkanoate synthesis regulator phasin